MGKGLDKGATQLRIEGQCREAKVAPVGEREAFEAWFFCPSNSLLAEWEDAAWEGFQAGAAHQRQQVREVVMPESYTCIGKGGEYELVGYALPAGKLREWIGRDTPDLAIYRSETDYFARTRQDFKERMEVIETSCARLNKGAGSHD